MWVSLNLFFYFWDLLRAALRPPEIDPVRVKYLYQTKDGRGGRSLPPPTPLGKDPPPPTTLFSVLVQGRRTELGRAGPSTGQTRRLVR